jgi:hypothetical protein
VAEWIKKKSKINPMLPPMRATLQQAQRDMWKKSDDDSRVTVLPSGKADVKSKTGTKDTVRRSVRNRKGSTHQEDMAFRNADLPALTSKWTEY